MHFNWPASDALIVNAKFAPFVLSTQTVVEDCNVEFLRITISICNLRELLILFIYLYVEC